MMFHRGSQFPSHEALSFITAMSGTVPSMSDGTVFVGRKTELALLRGWIDGLVSGTGRAVLIDGEPGIGKSSLVRAAASIAEDRGCHVYQATTDELGQALPLRPVLDALAAHESAGEPRLATIRRLLRGELAGRADPVVAASEQILTLVAELCSAAPTVLVIDDLQWADLATISVWKWLSRSADRMPLLLLGTTRPVPERNELLAAQRSRVGVAGIIRLAGLTNSEVGDLTTSLVGGKPSGELLRLAGGAAGNPLYLTELMDGLVRAGRTTVSESGTVEVTGGRVPDSLLGAIADRLFFLPRDVRRMLQAAALLGVEFRVSDLALVLNLRVADLVPAIDQARTAGVLKEAGPVLLFRHPLIREALYDDIAASVRVAWHLDAAKALAAAGGPVASVARQLLRAISSPSAGPLDESLLDWMVAAAPTLVAQTPQAAVDLLRQATTRSPASSPRGAALSCRLADALYRSGDCAEAETVAVKAMSVISDPDQLVDLHWTLYQCRQMAGRSRESLETLAGTLAVPTIPAQLRARLLALTARAHRDHGEAAVAELVAAKALQAAERVGDRWAIAWALHVLIIVSMMRGDNATALPLFERAIQVVSDDLSLTDLGLLLQNNHAVALGELDRYPEAIVLAEEARELADRAGNLVRLAQAHGALGQLLFAVGRWDDAQAEVEVLSDEFKDPSVICCDRGIAAVIAFHRGDPKTARQHLSLAMPSAAKIRNRVIASLTLARSLDCEVSRAPAEALAVLLASVTNRAEELAAMEDLLPEAARLAVRTGTVQAATDIAARVASIALRSPVPRRLAADAYCRGLVQDDPTLLLNAADRYGEASRPLLRAKALEAAAISFVHRKDQGSARMAFTRAEDQYDQLGAVWDIDHLRAQLRPHGIRRGSRAKHRKSPTGWESLTPTELRIARMVTNGLSNRQIAEQLVLSTRTIDAHVSHILTKLGMRSRVDIARTAANHVSVGD